MPMIGGTINQTPMTEQEFLNATQNEAIRATHLQVFEKGDELYIKAPHKQIFEKEDEIYIETTDKMMKVEFLSDGYFF